MTTVPMPKRARFVAAALCAALAGLLPSGCGDRAARKPVYTVTGRVLVRGAPAAHARILLVPLGGDDRDALRPRATTDASGKFAVTTYEPGDGAPAGEYAVGVTWRGPQQGQGAVAEPDPARKDFGKEEGRLDYFKSRYQDPKKSGLKVKVEPAPTVVPDIVLK